MILTDFRERGWIAPVLIGALNLVYNVIDALGNLDFLVSQDPGTVMSLVLSPWTGLAFLIAGVLWVGFESGAIQSWWALRNSPTSESLSHDFRVMARLRWDDATGKPVVRADNGRLVSVWAAFDIELRNLAVYPQRVSDVYLELWTTRFPNKLVLGADPVRVDTEFDWNKRSNLRRVEWQFEPVSAALTHNVCFEKYLCEPERPVAAKSYEVALVAELGSPRKRIRIRLQQDITGGLYEFERSEPS
jgi:hypothetical protein